MNSSILRVLLAPWLMPGTVTIDEWCDAVDHAGEQHDEDDLHDPDYAEFVLNREADFESLLETYR